MIPTPAANQYGMLSAISQTKQLIHIIGGALESDLSISDPNIKMSNTNTKSSEEITFKSYTPALAKAYAAGRTSYHESLFKIILHHHRSTGGAMQVLLDVGCGPGRSTRPLAMEFRSAFGIDASPEMINTAKNLSSESPNETASGKSITFTVGRAEDMNGPFRAEGHGVDLLVSGTAVRVLLANKPHHLDIT